MSSSLAQPLIFEPIFVERVWGGRRLETVFGKRLPAGKRIGESWEIVDRPEAQSIVRQGARKGRTLHQLWCEEREEVFGCGLPDTPRFPILAKLLDASEKLSLQVHPPESIAESLGGEAKSELWYFAASEEGAEVFAGFRPAVGRDAFVKAINHGSAADLVHRIPVKTGDSFFVPSGRLHGIGAGNLVIEIQQNSDTTYRVFDWERKDESGRKRALHLTESLQSIRFDDCEPQCLSGRGEQLIDGPHFVVEKWELNGPRRVLDRAAFAIFVCVSGAVETADLQFQPGDFWLMPANAGDAIVRSLAPATTLLRVTLPVR